MNLFPIINRRRFLVALAVLVPGCKKAAETAAPPPPPAPPPLAGGARDFDAVPVRNKVPPEVIAFAARKEAQAKELAAKLNVEPSPEFWAFFDAVQKEDWDRMVLSWKRLRRRAGQYEGSTSDPAVATPVWQTVLETQLAYEQFETGEPDHMLAAGREIIESIPKGSIYFGGTDPGRGLPTALSKSHETGEPFFTITQNALADGNYLAYVREIYSAQIYVPSSEDSQHAFQDYMSDAQRRLEHDQQFPGEPRQLKPGEDVRKVDNRVQVSGQVAVMSINGLLCKVIFDHNPTREFYVEESFPLDWMYPHLTPNGPIMAIKREPLPVLSEEIVARDQQYWRERMRKTVGDWLKPETAVKEVCAFAEKVYGQKDLAGFAGDRKYVESDLACKFWSKLRSSIGGMYAWRMNQAKDPAENRRMKSAADLAFRQAFALCPYSPEAVFRYVSLLAADARIDDALLLAQTANGLGMGNAQFANLMDELERQKEQRAKGNK